MNRGLLYTLLSLAFVATILVKTLFFSHLFSDGFVFDEIYYVTSARYIYHRLGLYSGFRPPIVGNTTVYNNTIIIDVSVSSGLITIPINLGRYNWLNVEHPILGKIVIGAILLASGDSLVLTRIALLAFSAITVFLFSRRVLEKYGLLSLVGMALVAALDWCYYHFTYLAVLDTLMIDCILISLYFLLDGRYREGIIFMSLSIAFKEIAVAFALGLVLYMVLRGRGRDAITLLLASATALAIGYGLYTVFVPLHMVVGSLISLASIVDPFACKNLCLTGLEYTWGMFKLYTPLVWLWFAGLACLAVEERVKGEVENSKYIPFSVALVYILFVVFIGYKRAIYPFYYAPLIILLPTITPSFSILADIFLCLKRRYALYCDI